MEAYFDNGATTRVFSQVKDIMIKVMEEDYGNPSSMHMKGVRAEQYVKEAKEKHCKDSESRTERNRFLLPVEQNPTIWR